MTHRLINYVFSLAIILIISCSNNGLQSETKVSGSNVFADLDYDRVVAYNYDGQGYVEIIDKDGKLAGRIMKQVELSKAQMIKLTNGLCDSSTYGGNLATCFDPHLGIVFYKTNKPVAHISICLNCNYLVSSVKIPAEDDAGFSSEGIKRIIDFEKELKFRP